MPSYQNVARALGSDRGTIDPTTSNPTIPFINGYHPQISAAEHHPSAENMNAAYLYSLFALSPLQLVSDPFQDELHHAPNHTAQTLGGHSATTQMPPASCSGTPCQWLTDGASGICGSMITCASVPSHFKKVHGVTNINELDSVGCRWWGCFRTYGRKNFVRHVRECHLKHSRGGGHSS